MTQEIEEHIAAVEGLYRRPLTDPGSRLAGGARLWSQFDEAVAAFRQHGRRQVAGVIERVNELVVARQLLLDASLASAEIAYEPEIVPGGTKFDFVATDAEGLPVYIEVKTVEPKTEDSDRNWQKAERRQEHLTPGNRYVVAKDWLGAAIFGNSFAARSSFMGYTLETEMKLAAHDAIRPGRAILVFCGTGFAWHVSELEDFADYYSTGRHRIDDPFAKMEAHAIAHGRAAPARTLAGFAALVRKHDDVEPRKWVYPVRGPGWDAIAGYTADTNG